MSLLTPVNAPPAYCVTTHQCQLDLPAISSEAPWLYVALSELSDLQKRGEDVRGVGDFRINEITASNTRLLLSLIDLQDLPIPTVSPFSGGGVSVVWMLGPKEVNFTIFPDQEITFLTAKGDVVSSDGMVDLKRQSDVTQPLKWLIRG